MLVERIGEPVPMPSVDELEQRWKTSMYPGPVYTTTVTAEQVAAMDATYWITWRLRGAEPVTVLYANEAMHVWTPDNRMFRVRGCGFRVTTPVMLFGELVEDTVTRRVVLLATECFVRADCQTRMKRAREIVSIAKLTPDAARPPDATLQAVAYKLHMSGLHIAAVLASVPPELAAFAVTGVEARASSSHDRSCVFSLNRDAVAVWRQLQQRPTAAPHVAPAVVRDAAASAAQQHRKTRRLKK